ncbi:MAG TPA: hypothetical protein VG389_27060 [Myxococcota bacterium]|jgi:YVTN family beta-propeller protein|nr:hypothetical protein [Myxococcota bacterium]
MRRQWLVWCLATSLALPQLAGCKHKGSDAGTDSGGGGSDSGTDGGPGPAARTTPTNGGAVALSSDGTVAVTANRTAGEITVMRLDYTAVPPTATLVESFDVGDAEPWAAVVGNDDDTAFVVLRKSKEVVKLTGIGSADPDMDATRAPTDAEPSGLAISPTGAKLYVSNWAAGTVTVVDAATMAVDSTVDLNAALAASGLLGPSVSESNARPGLAHPYAVVVTNDGDSDDTDETVFVTDFFSMGDPAADAAALGNAFFDEGRLGVVYRFSAGTGVADVPITLSSVNDTGFADSAGNATGCFPNQLYGAALNNGRLYVTSVCASPRGPVAGGAANFKTKVHGLVSVVDVVAGAELPGERVLLTRAFQDLYDAAGTADDATRRFPLIPNAIAFVPGQTIAYVTAYGADAVFRVEYAADGSLDQVGGARDFIDLADPTFTGRLPIGIAVTGDGHGLVLNEYTRNLSIILFSTQTVVNAVATATAPAAGAETDTNDGRRFFVTGLGRWSLNGQSWGSCEGCHPSGLTDNVTWYFANGPRQTVSLEGSFAPGTGAHRLFNWSAVFDENHDFELNTRGVSGGVGAIVTSSTLATSSRIIFDGTAPPAGASATTNLQNGLNGSTRDLVTTGVPGTDGSGNPVAALVSVQPDWEKIDLYVRSIRAPRAPALDPADVAAGAAIFTGEGGCVGCHGGAGWTISARFYTPGAAANGPGGTLSTTTYSRGALPLGLNPVADAGGGMALIKTGASIDCVLRSVGTFPPDPATDPSGIAPAGVGLVEVRDDMVTVALGANGFNPPSLLGAVAGAPYFHGGNARTLEELLDPLFEGHYQALGTNFNPTPDQIRQLVAFLLSIDDDATALDPTLVGFDPIICPDSL